MMPEAAPWMRPSASITRGQTAAAPGDTIYVRGGVYSFTAGTNKCASQTDTVNAIVLNKNGSSGNLIHYLAYPGEIPVFDFSKMKDDCRVKGFDVTGSWIHLKGLEVKGVPQNNMLNHESWGVWISGSNNIFEQLNLHHNMGPGLFIQNGGNNLVLNCDSHHNYDPMTSNGAGQSADGFGAHISAGAANTGNVFRGCRAWWNTDDGFDLINAFEPVVIENSWAWYHGYLPDTMTSIPDGNGNGFKAGGYGTDTSKFPSTVPKHVVRQCLSVQNKASGFYANHHPGPVIFNNNTGYNNKPSFNLLGMDASGQRHPRRRIAEQRGFRRLAGLERFGHRRDHQLVDPERRHRLRGRLPEHDGDGPGRSAPGRWEPAGPSLHAPRRRAATSSTRAWTWACPSRARPPISGPSRRERPQAAAVVGLREPAAQASAVADEGRAAARPLVVGPAPRAGSQGRAAWRRDGGGLGGGPASSGGTAERHWGSAGGRRWCLGARLGRSCPVRPAAAPRQRRRHDGRRVRDGRDTVTPRAAPATPPARGRPDRLAAGLCALLVAAGMAVADRRRRRRSSDARGAPEDQGRAVLS